MSYFRQLAHGLMSPALDQNFGEAVTVTPMCARPNFTPERDKLRAPWQAIAIFSWKSDLALGGGERHDRRPPHNHKTDDALRVVSRRPCFSFAATAIPLRRADVIARCETGDLFEITEIRPDGVARIEAHCVQLGLQSQVNA